MAARTLASALLNGKCPRCREGDMFIYPASDLTRFAKMHQSCPYCGIRLQPEPGFYQGAMYVGYGFTITAILLISLLLYLLADPSEWVYIGTIIGVSILFAPLNYRYSRIVYLYSFGGIKYDPSRSK